jgi:hypothetical protein
MTCLLIALCAAGAVWSLTRQSPPGAILFLLAAAAVAWAG